MTQQISPEQASTALQQLADQLLVEEAREWPAQTLHEYFASVIPQYRHDQVIRTVAGMVEKIAQRTPNKPITAHELQAFYNSVVGLNPRSAFKSVFAHLLPIPIEVTADNNQQYIEGHRHDMFDVARNPEVVAQTKGNVIEVDEFSDEEPQLRNHLGELTHPDDFVCDPALVDEAQALVTSELQRLGQQDINARLAFANQELMLIRLAFRGSQGEALVAVPVSIHEGQLLIPTDFATEERSYPLTPGGLESYFEDCRIQEEQQERKAAQRIRDIYAGDVRALEEVGDIEIDENELIGEDEQPVALPDALQDVEEVLITAVLRKKSRYADNTIDDAAAMLQQRLRELGFQNVQVSFLGDAQVNAMRFNARVLTAKGQTEIGIPIEVNDQNVLAPVVFVGQDDMIYEFSSTGFQSYLNKTETVEPIKYGAEMLDLTYNDLQKVIHKAALDGQSHVATEALNLIADKFGSEAYNSAVADYQVVLANAYENCERSSCEGCSFFHSARQENAPYADDRCLLLNIACKRVVKKAGGQGPRFCARNEPNFRDEYDDSYSGLLNTSQISLT